VYFANLDCQKSGGSQVNRHTIATRAENADSVSANPHRGRHEGIAIREKCTGNSGPSSLV
jgi:hypothetical protein